MILNTAALFSPVFCFNQGKYSGTYVVNILFVFNFLFSIFNIFRFADKWRNLKANPRQMLGLHNLLPRASWDKVGNFMLSNNGKLREDKLIFWAPLRFVSKVGPYSEKLRFLGTLTPFLHPNRHWGLSIQSSLQSIHFFHLIFPVSLD